MAITQQAIKLRPNELYNGGSSGVRTFYYKFEFDGPFDQAQFLVGSKQATGTPGTYKVQLAVTDEIGIDTTAKAWLPRVAGVTYNDKSANGWKDATFGGAATKQIGLAPNDGNNSVKHMSTDVMNLSSIPRADGKPGGILLVKVTQTDSAGQYYSANGASNTWDTARGIRPWFREWRASGVNFDAIADLTKLPADGYNGGYEFPGFPIVTSTASTIPMEVVLFTGDSRKCAAYMTYLFGAPARMAAASLSTPGRPISTVNASGSGHSQTQYQAIAMDMINNGLRPTLVHAPAFSQNGFSNFATFKTNLDNFMAAVRAVSGLADVKFVLDTDYGVKGYPGDARESQRQQCIAYAKSLHNGTTVFCFDSDPIITDYSVTTTTGVPMYAPYRVGGDDIHVGPSGLNVLAYGAGPSSSLTQTYASALGATNVVVVPGAPTVGTATAGNGSASVGGTAPAATNGGAITGYRATSSPGGITATSATLPVNVTGLTAGTGYTFTLAAQNSAGYGPESFASNSVTPTAAETPTPDTTGPVMVGDITVSAITTSGATLSCQAATDAVGVAGYEYSINGGANYTVIPNAARSVVVSGRPAGTLHEVRMRAFDAAGNRSQQPLAKSFTTLAEQPAQNAVVASTVAESRRVAFPGGTRVVAFGSVPGARTPNAPYLEAGKWWSEKHPLDERYWVANLTIDLAERGTTAVSVEAIVAGVTVLQQPVIQGKLIPVKLGGFNAATGAVNFCTFRVTCANGERFDRTIWFKQQVGSWSLEKDADDESYFVVDISNDLADSNTTASAVLALPVGVSVLVPAVIQGALILVKLGGMDTLPASVNYCDLRIDCANSERFYRTIQFNRVDN
jgi:hypothetical protein